MEPCAVLVVEDDPAIRLGLVDALKFAGYQVHESADGDDAREKLKSVRMLDLVLLDVVLPGVEGFELLELIRSTRPQLPVIMVTARGAETDRIRGLKNGADDYVVKPFSAKELLARVEAVLRRSGPRSMPVQSLSFDGGSVCLARREIDLGTGTKKQLSDKESAILLYLAEARDRAVSREELLQQVWGLNPRGLSTRTVDMHVARLREKLGDSVEPKVVLTVRAKGYMLAESVQTVTG